MGGQRAGVRRYFGLYWQRRRRPKWPVQLPVRGRTLTRQNQAAERQSKQAQRHRGRLGHLRDGCGQLRRIVLGGCFRIDDEVNAVTGGYRNAGESLRAGSTAVIKPTGAKGE